MSRKKGTKIASDGGPELTSAGVPWSEVPGFARPDVAWIDGRPGWAQAPLPSVDVVPVPDILNSLPYPHEDRPLGSKSHARCRRCAGETARCASWGLAHQSLQRLEVGQVAEWRRRLASGRR
jgi:hypothetical protein